MKKSLTFILFVFIIGKINAQNETDVLNLSQYFTGGTARGIALSGAYGALGGDVTSLSINPAGIGVYRSSELVFTPTLTMTDTKSSFYNSNYTDTKTTFGLGNFGLILNSNSNRDIGWVSASFGFGYNKLIDFNKNTTIIGRNPNTSFLDEFTLRANNIVDQITNPNLGIYFNPDDNYDDLDYYYSQLAIDANAIFFVDSLGYYKVDNYYDGYNQQQTRTLNERGNVGEYAFSFGANYSNKFFLGATLGLQSVYYSKAEMHDEVSSSSIALNEFNYHEDYTLRGNGLNFKLGMIFKPIDIFRLGIAFHTPTYYSLKNEFTNSMQTWFNPGNTQYNKELYSDYTEYDFTVTSPLKLILSGALQSKIGFLSFDYEYVDYSASKVKFDNFDINDEVIVNKSIQDAYRATSNLKVGGELKLEQFAVRGGYGFYGSPYNKNEFNKDANTQTFSLGLGYRSESMFVDFGYIAFLTKYKYKLYNYDAWDSNDNYYAASETSDIEQKSSRFVLTVGFRF